MSRMEQPNSDDRSYREGCACIVHNPSEADIAMLRASGYLAFETFDEDGKHLKTWEEWNSPPLHYTSYHVYFLSLTNSARRICHFDLFNERDIGIVQELLESQSIVKVTRKVAFASQQLNRHYQIVLRSVIDLTATNYLVNQVGSNSGNLVNPRIIDDVGDTVQENMIRLARIWLRLYGSLYANLITLTEQNLMLFRTFQLD